jgi:hypothetical protein
MQPLESTAPKWVVLLPICMTAGLAWLSTIPGIVGPQDPAAYRVVLYIPPSVQSLLHIPAYTVLSALWRWSLPAWPIPRHLIAWLAGAAAGVYGICDEFIQAFTPGRYASVTDLALNWIGVGVGLWLARARG